MNLSRVEAIVNAVLYEGYILYPYRPSSVKNRQRWTFGGVYPSAYAAVDESCAAAMQTECLVRGGPETRIEVLVRFLQLIRRDVGALPVPIAHLPADGEPVFGKVASLEVGGEVFHAWEEAIERDVGAPGLTIAEITGGARRVPFRFEGERALEPLREADGLIAGVLIRESATLEGALMIGATEVTPGVFRLTVRIENLTPFDVTSSASQADGQWRAFASTHTILGVQGGAFISLLDPPAGLEEAAAACENQGTWPVMAGEEGATDTVLSSPIILYDYPQVAPESPGDLFDATEIDEILTLRILAMTDGEKREMAASDPRARALLERTEGLTAADMERLHGTLRNPHFGSGRGPAEAVKPELAFLHLGGRDLKIGDRVWLRPKAGGDVMDLVLKDELAVIEAIELDFEDKVHIAVVLDADPGREFGLDRMPGHRFFFSPEELEPVDEDASA
jgi:hypothetical protein